MPDQKIINVNYRGQDLEVSIKLRASGDHLILFLHGLGCVKECFDEAFTAPGLKPYSILTLDLPGFGASTKRDSLEYSMEEDAAVVELVLAQLAPKRLSIVAHSMSGAVGLLLTRNLTNLDWFINVEGNLVADDCGIATRGEASLSESDYVAFGYDKFKQGLAQSSDPSRKHWAKWLSRSSPTAVHRACVSVVEWSDSGELIDIYNALPKKVYIYGEREDKHFLLPLLDQKQVRMIPGTTHFMMIEDPAIFYSAVVAILSN